MLGFSLSYLGVFVLVSFSSPYTGQTIDTFGVGLALLSTVFWALYWIAGKRSRSDPTSLTFIAFSTALPLSLIVCLNGPGLPEIDRYVLTFGLWVGLIEMGITYILWQRALERASNTGRMAQLIFYPLSSQCFLFPPFRRKHHSIHSDRSTNHSHGYLGHPEKYKRLSQDH